jgi:hypothetical protein
MLTIMRYSQRTLSNIHWCKYVLLSLYGVHLIETEFLLAIIKQLAISMGEG